MNRVAKTTAQAPNDIAIAEVNGRIGNVVEGANGASTRSQPKQGDAPPPMRLMTADLKSTYCNVCSATSTREEVVLNFGTNHNWDRPERDLEIELHHRIVLSPFAAKRLKDLMTKLIEEHETRYGELR